MISFRKYFQYPLSGWDAQWSYCDTIFCLICPLMQMLSAVDPGSWISRQVDNTLNAFFPCLRFIMPAEPGGSQVFWLCSFVTCQQGETHLSASYAFIVGQTPLLSPVSSHRAEWYWGEAETRGSLYKVGVIRGGLHVVLSTEDKTTLARTIAASATWRERTGYLV